MSRWLRKAKPDPEPDEATRALSAEASAARSYLRRAVTQLADELGEHADSLREFVAHTRTEGEQ